MSNLSAMIAQRPRDIVTSLTRCFAAKLVPIVRSSPGMGKSQIAAQIAYKYNLKLIDIRLAQSDPSDLNGLPYFTEENFAKYAPFEEFPLKGRSPGLNPEGVLYNGWLMLFDEITSAQKQIQAASYKIILDRKIGQEDLHDDVVMMAAGNHEGDNAVVIPMSTALQSRLIHLDMMIHKDDWIEWAIKHDVDSRVIAFIGFKPSLLHRFLPDSQEHTYPCPRTWEFTSRLVKGQEKLTSLDLPLVAGAISPGPATEFIEFSRIYDTLPKINEIIANPSGVVIPNELGVKFALSTMLTEYFNDSNAKELIEFLRRLPVECRVITLRMISVKQPSSLRHPEVAKLFGELGRAMTL